MGWTPPPLRWVRLHFRPARWGATSLSTNALPVTILQCGTAGLCDDLIISEYVEGTSNNKALRSTTPRRLRWI